MAAETTANTMPPSGMAIKIKEPMVTGMMKKISVPSLSFPILCDAQIQPNGRIIATICQMILTGLCLIDIFVIKQKNALHANLKTAQFSGVCI